MAPVNVVVEGVKAAAAAESCKVDVAATGKAVGAEGPKAATLALL